jgi:MoaA/NifB/PqqE/SkfB family radical SAM enzyme
MNEALLGARLLRHWVNRNRNDVVDIIKTKLFITKRCNLECRHCGIGEAGFDDSEELTTEQVIAIWTANPRLQLVSLSGGEPFLRDDIVEVSVKAAQNLPHLMVLSVNTNGWFTDRVVRFAREVIAALPSRAQLLVTCSSDGPKEVHSLIRRSNESFERKEATLDALRKISDRKLTIRHNININPWNLDTIVDFIEKRETRGEKCLISLYSGSPHYAHTPQHYRDLRDFRKEIFKRKKVIQHLRKRKSFLGNRFLDLAEGYYRNPERKQPIPCFSLRACCIIEPDGTVRPCINFPKDLGRIQDHEFSLRQTVLSARAETLCEAIREQNCPICWTPNEAYMTIMCNLPNPDLWKHPVEALALIPSIKK